MIEQLQKEINASKVLYNNIIENQNDLYALIIIISIILIITIVSTSIFAYIKGKQNEKGKIQARQESLKDILEEQKNITNTIETIKMILKKEFGYTKKKILFKDKKLMKCSLYLLK